MQVFMKQGTLFLMAFLCILSSWANTPVEEEKPLTELNIIHQKFGGIIETYEVGQLVSVKIRGKARRVKGALMLKNENEISIGGVDYSMSEVKNIQKWEQGNLAAIKSISGVTGAWVTGLGLATIAFGITAPVAVTGAIFAGISSVATGQLMILPSLLINPRYKINRKFRIEAS